MMFFHFSGGHFWCSCLLLAFSSLDRGHIGTLFGLQSLLQATNCILTSFYQTSSFCRSSAIWGSVAHLLDWTTRTSLCSTCASVSLGLPWPCRYSYLGPRLIDTDHCRPGTSHKSCSGQFWRCSEPAGDYPTCHWRKGGMHPKQVKRLQSSFWVLFKLNHKEQRKLFCYSWYQVIVSTAWPLWPEPDFLLLIKQFVHCSLHCDAVLAI